MAKIKQFEAFAKMFVPYKKTGCNPPQGAFLIPLVNIGGSFIGGQGTLYKLNWQVLGIG